MFIFLYKIIKQNKKNTLANPSPVRSVFADEPLPPIALFDLLPSPTSTEISTLPSAVFGLSNRALLPSGRPWSDPAFPKPHVPIPILAVETLDSRATCISLARASWWGLTENRLTGCGRYCVPPSLPTAPACRRLAGPVELNTKSLKVQEFSQASRGPPTILIMSGWLDRIRTQLWPI